MLTCGDKVIAGVSGGADSVCLFLMLLELRKKIGFDLIAVHVHHGLMSRRRKRGFNQAEEIADRLSAVWEIPVEKHLLFRKKKTAPQKELGESGRLENLVSAFEADAGCAKQYRSVILVDDILTTGATMEACARALKHAGIEHVYMAALSAGAGPQMSGTRRERYFR